MALPAVVVALSRLGIIAGAKGPQKEKPKALSTEGVTMLTLALVLEFINIIIGILDFVVVGIILGPVVNFTGTILIGGWLWLRTGSLPIKKGFVPFLLNSIPILKFFPWWLFSVATSLDWKRISDQEQPQKEGGTQQEQPQQARQPA
jgi:hypothetical protein